MFTLKLTKSLGRTGNSLLCVINAIFFAMENDIEIVDFSELSWWTSNLLPNGPHELITSLTVKISKEDIKNTNNIDKDSFIKFITRKKCSIKWNKNNECFESWFCAFYDSSGTFEDRTYIVQKYIKPILKIPVLDCKSDDLVIHMRSGDIFKMKGHYAYIQPPLSFYVDVISSRTWGNIYIIAEDDRNPCFHKLKEKYPNIISFLDNKKERHGGNGFGFQHDLSWMISSCHYVACQSSLCPLIIQLSTKIKHVYLPSYILKTTGQNITKETRIWWTNNFANIKNDFTVNTVQYHVLNYDKYIERPEKMYQYEHAINRDILINYEEPKKKTYCSKQIYSANKIELVVARFNEDMSWTLEYDESIRKIYNKGKDNLNIPSIKLPNIGREGHTYLEYIINNYNKLPDFVIFSQGSTYDNHVKQSNVDLSTIKSLIHSADILYNTNVTYLGLNKSIRDNNEIPGWNMIRNYSDKAHKRLNALIKIYCEKYSNNLNLDPSNNHAFLSNYCGYFLVHKSKILMHDLKFYENLKEDLLQDNKGLETFGHVLERLWCPLFHQDHDIENIPSFSNYINKYNCFQEINGVKHSLRFFLIHNGDPERAAYMKQQFAQNGIDQNKVIWITYPNKDEITDELHSKIALDHHEKTKGQSCVTYKHFLAIKDLYFNPCDIGIIMEDNIRFFGNVPNAINKYIENMQQEWNLLFDSDILSHSKWKQFNPPPSDTGVMKSYHSSPSKGANFVMINTKNSICNLYKDYLPYTAHSDHNYNRVLKKHKMMCYWAVPYNVHHRGQESGRKGELKSTWKN